MLKPIDEREQELAIEAFADAWASMDGKLYPYRNKDDETGTREGYLVEAKEFIFRLNTRGFKVVMN